MLKGKCLVHVADLVFIAELSTWVPLIELGAKRGVLNPSAMDLGHLSTLSAFNLIFVINITKVN